MNAPNLEISLKQFQNIANFKKLVDIRAEKGYLVSGSAVSEWTFTGFRYEGGSPVLYGPPAPGITLDEILFRPREEALEAVGRLVRALLVLAEAKLTKVDVSPDSVRFLDDGSVLFLPAEVFRKLRLMSVDEYKAAHSRINDPYAADPVQGLSHAIGVLVYRIFTGAFPFEGKDLDEIHTRIRHQPVMAPRLRVPELAGEASAFVEQFFNNKKTRAGLADWDKAIAAWTSSGFTRPVSAAEQAELAKETSRLSGRRDRRLRRRLFWERRGRTVLIISLCAAAATAAVGSIVANALKPKLTAGLTPHQVVEAYYRAIATLDPVLMRDCLLGDAGAGELHRTEILFVTWKYSISQTNRDIRRQADQWAAAGRPRVDPPIYIDGVIGLEIRQEQGGAEPVFTASCERWFQEPGKGTSGVDTVFQVGQTVRERLTVKKDGPYWLISRVERLETREIYRSDFGYQPSAVK